MAPNLQVQDRLRPRIEKKQPQRLSEIFLPSPRLPSGAPGGHDEVEAAVKGKIQDEIFPTSRSSELQVECLYYTN